MLEKSVFFRGVDPEMIQALEPYCRMKHYAKGSTVFSMGDAATAFFVVDKGWIKLSRTSREGEEIIIHVLGPGESFSEAAVFMDQRIYPVNAQAVDDTVLLEIPRDVFVQNVQDNSRFALHMLGAIAARQHYLVQQLEQVTTRSAPQRIGAFLLRFCRKEIRNETVIWAVHLPYDKAVICARLNIKPETFSRALSKLVPHGVRVEKRSIQIYNIKQLMDFCDLSSQEVPCKVGP